MKDLEYVKINYIKVYLNTYGQHKICDNIQEP